MLEAVELVTAALVAGAVAGSQEAASTAVKDLYQALRSRIAGRNPGAAAALQANDAAPGSDLPALTTAISDTATHDPATRELAARLLAATSADDTPPTQHSIDLREARGVQVGDGNVQNNRF
ncbi:hypothetical protein [Nocardia salmonicida]|uniref:hypothetical protein n=1 Tax=Nocardia salmonicida TaxID=53431 RepID=UPI0033F1136D